MIRTSAEYSAALHVLVVANETLFRWALRETLGAAGHVVYEVGTDPIDVAHAVVESAADVVVIGPAMAPATQIDRIRLVVRVAPAVAVVVVNGETSRGSIFDLLRAGATRVTSDTVDVADVPAIVADANRCRPI
jgi:DNA-binding NarL/FixJ family response regulator